MEGQPVSKHSFSLLLFFSHHLFRPSSRRVYPLPFFRFIQMSARRSRINATRYARTTLMIREFSSRPTTLLFLLFPTRARAWPLRNAS